MQEYRLRTIDPQQMRTLYQTHMVKDFPPAERPKLDRILQQMQSGLLSGYLLTDGRQDYAYVLAVVQGDFVLYTHLAVFPDRRGGGVGSVLMQQLNQRFADIPVQIVEVENPAAAENEQAGALQQRRIAFYERAGYQVVPGLRYILFGVDMLLMTRTQGEAPQPAAQDVAQAMTGFYISKLPEAERVYFDLTLAE